MLAGLSLTLAIKKHDSHSSWGAELEQLAKWLANNHRVALVTVIATWGSSPRAVGSHMVIREDQCFFGSVSGGCIEGEVIRTAIQVIKEGQNRLLHFKVATDQAWEMGLSCGGRIELLIEAVDGHHPLVQRMLTPVAQETLWRLVKLVSGEQWLIESSKVNPDDSLPVSLSKPLTEAKKKQCSVRLDDDYFLQLYQAPTRLLIVGAVHIAQHLAVMASRCGLAPQVIDPRRGFARPERFPDTELVHDWPDRFLQTAPLRASNALVTLSHDPKIDDPALCTALDSEAFYIGALGSRKTHNERLQRLGKAGYGDRLQRIHGPVGLDLGGRAPAEIATAILAEIIQTRYRKDDHAAI
ncbi:MAG: XdhC family protein [Sedimenticola sp.]|nr:XdhC family protein [Sedimenticola sp.]